MIKPPIVGVISRYVDLRGSGKEVSGLCPFHEEKTSSFTVSEEKGLFHCFGCGEGGDVVRFIELIESLDFKGALAHLGLNDQPRPTRAEIKKRELVRQASKNLTAWALSVSESIGTQMREIGQRAHMARMILKNFPGHDDLLMETEIRRGEREREILSTLEEDLLDPKQTATMCEDRETIKRLVGDGSTYTNEEIEDAFPPITDAYKQRLVSYVRGEA